MGGLEQTRQTRGLVSSRQSGSRIGASKRTPPADLTDIVECFWSGWWDLRGQADHVTELISDPSMHVVAEWSDTEVSHRAVGVWTRLWTRRLTGMGRVHGVKLHPGASQALFESPAHHLANAQHPWSTGPLPQGPLWQDDDGARDAALTHWLRQTRRTSPDTPRAIAAVRHLQQPDVHRVAQAADRLNIGVRALQRLCAKHVGASPKWLLRRFRLQEAATRLDEGNPVAFADLAYELGYADQAHLARDFKQVTGRTLTDVAQQRGSLGQ